MVAEVNNLLPMCTQEPWLNAMVTTTATEPEVGEVGAGHKAKKRLGAWQQSEDVKENNG